MTFPPPNLPEAPIPPTFPPHHTRHHNIQFNDAFYPLRDIKNPKTRRYLRAENRYYNTVSRLWKNTARDLTRDIKKRIPEEDCSVPVRIGDWFYYSRTRKRKNYPIYCRKNAVTAEAKEEEILNINHLAEGTACCLVTGIAVSPDHSKVAYGITRTGGIDYHIHIRDLVNGKTLRDKIPSTDGDPAWSEDGQHLFYAARKRGDLRAWRIMRHTLGTAVKSDIRIYEESDETFECTVWKTKSDRYIVISSSSANTAEHHFADAKQPNAPFTLIAKRREGIEYYPEHLGDDFIILTNADQSADFKLMRTPVNNTCLPWETLLPHTPGILLEDFEVFQNTITVIERADALPRLRIFNPDTPKNARFFTPFHNTPFTLSYDDNPNTETDAVRVSFSSMIHPQTVSEIRFSDAAETRLKVQHVPGYTPDHYNTILLRVSSRDGSAKIPLSLVWRKDKSIENTPMPMILRAYGAYGISSDAGFRASRISLLDRGVLCGIAHVRGGEELGRAWYDGGRLMQKLNTFYDTLDCANFLIQSRHTAADKLILSGGSAGGLLTAAVVNMSPETFLGAVLEVPFVDVINTMTDPELPLTTGEYGEWGNPANSDAFRYILNYSPYDNIKHQSYPYLLLSGSLNDAQVPYWEPAKFTAKLRQMNPDSKNITLLKTDMQSGHLGPTGRKAEIAEIVREFSFCLWLFNLESKT